MSAHFRHVINLILVLWKMLACHKRKQKCVKIHKETYPLYRIDFIHPYKNFKCLDIDLGTISHSDKHPAEIVFHFEFKWVIYLSGSQLAANLTFETFNMVFTTGDICPKAKVSVSGLEGSFHSIGLCGQLDNLIAGLMSNDKLLVHFKGFFSASDRFKHFFL